MPTEADTCRTYVVAKLRAAGWEDDFSAEKRVIAPGVSVIQIAASKVSEFPLGRTGTLCRRRARRKQAGTKAPSRSIGVIKPQTNQSIDLIDSW